jgi:hypothetical protein
MKKLQGVGSSGEDLGLDGIPIRSRVRIPLGANNFLGPRPQQSRVLPNSCGGGGALHGSEVGTQSSPALGGSPS